jgi:pimeloyl-ACP methyl ester carboxylesterase
MLALAPLSVVLPGCAPGPDKTLVPYANVEDQVRLPDGRMIHLVCMGKGSPVVILTAGAGDWSSIWNKVQPAIASKTRVCAWDRAGRGLSDPSPKPETVDQTTSDLEATLEAAHVAGPWVVVGHSAGGYESLLLKDRHPSDVAGMVLVDPSIPDQFKRSTPAMKAWAQNQPNPFVALVTKCTTAFRAGTVRHGGPDPDHCLHPPRPPNWPPQLREIMDRRQATMKLDDLAADGDDTLFYGSPQADEQNSRIVLKPHRNYGAMPLVVLTAGDALQLPPDAPDAVKAELPLQQADWRRGHDAYAALSTRGVNRTVAGSSHYIHQIKPQAVIDAVDEVVDDARGSGPTKESR